MPSPTIIPTKGYHVRLGTQAPPEEIKALVPISNNTNEYSTADPWDDDDYGWTWRGDVPWNIQETPTVETLPEDNIIDVVPVSDEGQCFIMYLAKASQCKQCQIWTRTMHNPVDTNGNSVLRCQRCCEVCG